MLLSRAACGTTSASHVIELWPHWLKLVRASRSMGSLARSHDHVHEVLTRLVEKLARPEGGGLHLYAPWRERHPEKTFGDWIRIVVKNQIRDYVREQLGPPRGADDGPSLKRLLNEFASSPVLEELGVRPPVTAAQTARELLEFARRKLPAEQTRVLGLWLEGASFEEAGGELGLEAAAAQRLLRAAVATLRREFAKPAS